MTWRGLALPALLLLLWQVAAGVAGAAGHAFISPFQVCVGLGDLARRGLPPGHLLHLHVLYSLARVLAGFSIAVVVGLPAGMAMGASGLVRTLVRPLVDFLRPIPPLAWIPLAVPWFGFGIPAAAFIIFLGAFFPISLNTCSGVAAVDRRYVDVARTLDASRRDVWLKVLLPGALPSILTGLRVGMGIAWMTLVAAEFADVREGYGLGYMVMAGRDLQRMDAVLAGMAAIGVTGLALEWGLRRLSERLLRCA